MQKRLKQSLHRIWKEALTQDWISPEKAKTLPVLEFYTGLRWTEIKKALKNQKKEMKSIYEIFNVIDQDEEPEPKNIFIEGKQDARIIFLQLSVLVLRKAKGVRYVIFVLLVIYEKV